MTKHAGSACFLATQVREMIKHWSTSNFCKICYNQIHNFKVFKKLQGETYSIIMDHHLRQIIRLVTGNLFFTFSNIYGVIKRDLQRWCFPSVGPSPWTSVCGFPSPPAASAFSPPRSVACGVPVESGSTRSLIGSWRPWCRYRWVGSSHSDPFSCLASAFRAERPSLVYLCYIWYAWLFLPNIALTVNHSMLIFTTQFYRIFWWLKIMKINNWHAAWTVKYLLFFYIHVWWGLRMAKLFIREY